MVIGTKDALLNYIIILTISMIFIISALFLLCWHKSKLKLWLSSFYVLLNIVNILLLLLTLIVYISCYTGYLMVTNRVYMTAWLFLSSATLFLLTFTYLEIHIAMVDINHRGGNNKRFKTFAGILVLSVLISYPNYVNSNKKNYGGNFFADSVMYMSVYIIISNMIPILIIITTLVRIVQRNFDIEKSLNICIAEKEYYYEQKNTIVTKKLLTVIILIALCYLLSAMSWACYQMGVTLLIITPNIYTQEVITMTQLILPVIPCAIHILTIKSTENLLRSSPSVNSTTQVNGVDNSRFSYQE